MQHIVCSTPSASTSARSTCHPPSPTLSRNQQTPPFHLPGLVNLPAPGSLPAPGAGAGEPRAVAPGSGSGCIHGQDSIPAGAVVQRQRGALGSSMPRSTHRQCTKHPFRCPAHTVRTNASTAFLGWCWQCALRSVLACVAAKCTPRHWSELRAILAWVAGHAPRHGTAEAARRTWVSLQSIGSRLSTENVMKRGECSR
eukprot:Hpha_TRINITY_DN27408_c0_g1::TRINITY_DN27408_c0_g1_i1::g.193786::m.193786